MNQKRESEHENAGVIVRTKERVTSRRGSEGKGLVQRVWWRRGDGGMKARFLSSVLVIVMLVAMMVMVLITPLAVTARSTLMEMWRCCCYWKYPGGWPS